MLKVKILVRGDPFGLFLVLIATFVDENVAVVYDRVEMLHLLVVIVLLVERHIIDLLQCRSSNPLIVVVRLLSFLMQFHLPVQLPKQFISLFPFLALYVLRAFLFELLFCCYPAFSALLQPANALCGLIQIALLFWGFSL